MELVAQEGSGGCVRRRTRCLSSRRLRRCGRIEAAAARHVPARPAAAQAELLRAGRCQPASADCSGRGALRAATRAPYPLRRRSSALAAVLEEGGEAWWLLGSDLPNERPITTTAELLDALSTAGDRLVVVHFYAQWCGACKALHPKLVQIIAARDDILFLKVDFDANKTMCRTLGVKVLPFFHLYRGPSGRVAEFSASLSKIQRLRDALEEHGAARCCIGESTPALPAELLGGA